MDLEIQYPGLYIIQVRRRAVGQGIMPSHMLRADHCMAKKRKERLVLRNDFHPIS